MACSMRADHGCPQLMRIQLRKFFPLAEKIQPGAMAIRYWLSARAASAVVSSFESNSIHKTNPPCGREILIADGK